MGQHRLLEIATAHNMTVRWTTEGCSDSKCQSTDKFTLNIPKVHNADQRLEADSTCADVCLALVDDGCRFWATGPEDDAWKCWLRSSDVGRVTVEDAHAAAVTCASSHTTSLQTLLNKTRMRAAM